MRNIVWLASYPKSGNTWLRAFLTNFQSSADVPADINDLGAARFASTRCTADEALGIESSDLTWEEIDCYRPAIYRYLAAQSHDLLFVKSHDAYTLNCNTEPIIPADVTMAGVYVVRNPLDVAVSLAHYRGIPPDDAIDQMASETATLSGHRERLSFHLRQTLLSWSRHALSWIDQHAIPLHVIRYEDMSRRPLETFRGLIQFLGLPDDVEKINRAVAFSAFDKLRQQELESGFREKPVETAAFFRRGRAGAWKETLTNEQVGRLVRTHEAVMRRLGYLSEAGFPE
ncbi:MAG TPA: sulfotransferase domain-containing protein [Bryobacteraceae bacterium]|nr:sulfotransferase domain-containing protein [Bryobacteraceae bacterium]